MVHLIAPDDVDPDDPWCCFRSEWTTSRGRTTMTQHLGENHIREMTTWQTPPRPLSRRRPPPRRSETLLAMLLIPMLVAMIVMMLLVLPLLAVA